MADWTEVGAYATGGGVFGNLLVWALKHLGTVKTRAKAEGVAEAALAERVKAHEDSVETHRVEISSLWMEMSKLRDVIDESSRNHAHALETAIRDLRTSMENGFRAQVELLTTLIRRGPAE